MSNASDAIRKSLPLMVAGYSDDEVVDKLVADGVLRSVAERAIAFVPLAFGRVMLEGSGITLPDTYVVSRDGAMIERPLAEEPVYQQAYADAKNGRVAAPIFQSVVLRSAELDAVNQALNHGIAIEDVIMGPPALVRITDDTEPKKKKWWQF